MTPKLFDAEVMERCTVPAPPRPDYFVVLVHGRGNEHWHLLCRKYHTDVLEFLNHEAAHDAMVERCDGRPWCHGQVVRIPGTKP